MGVVGAAAIVGSVAAVVLARRYGLNTASLIAALIGLPLGTVGLVIAILPPNSSQAFDDVVAVADRLAALVRQQWEEEASSRWLNTPYPLAVRFQATQQALAMAVDWSAIIEAARRAPGRPSRPSDSWASGPFRWAAPIDQISAAFKRVPTRRLVVLGEPGAGKSVLAMQLTLDLLEARAAGDPVPVLLSLASWNPLVQPFWIWLTGRLSSKYPFLGRPGSSGGNGNVVQTLIANALIVPVLDGLDEISDEARSNAISALNDALRPRNQVLLTCRTKEYSEAVREGSAMIEQRLSGAAVVEILPLDVDDIADYLHAAFPGTAAARWDPVLSAPPTSPVLSALSTPLMLSLARVVYATARPSGSYNPAPTPAELLDALRFNTPESIEDYLLGAFVSSAYRQTGGRRICWSAERASRWLTFLARHLECRGSSELAWWQLHLAAPRLMVGVTIGAAGFLVFGLAVGLVATPMAGVGAGAIFGLTVGLASDAAANGPRLVAPRRIALELDVRGLLAGLTTGLVCGLIFGVLVGPLTGFAIGLSTGLVGATDGIVDSSVSLALLAGPRRALAADRIATLVVGLGAGLLFGITFGQMAEMWTALIAGAMASFVMIVRSSWLRFCISRIFLAIRQDIPWRFVAFLEDAHLRDVLRRGGAVYQFRHKRLQERLVRESET